MKKYLAFLIAFVITISGISVSVSAKSDRLGEYEHSDKKFTDFEYEHFDYAELEKDINELKDLCSSKDNIDKAAELVDKIENSVFVFYDMQVYARYMYTRNSTDSYWKEENLYASEGFQNITTLYVGVLQEAFVSPCKEAFGKWYSEEDMKKILGTNVPTPEQMECSKKQREMVTEYLEINPKVEYMGETYDVYGLIDAYNSGDLSDFAMMLLYPQILGEIKSRAADVYFRMIENNTKYAKLLGYDNYMDYAFEKVYGRKYTPEDAIVMCTEIREKLEPYYMTFGYYNSSYLDKKVNESFRDGVLDILGKYVGKLAPEIEEAYKYMIDSESCMIIPVGESSTSFTDILMNFGMPFICMTESADDLKEMETLAHEFGHYNSFYWRDIKENPQNALDLEETYSQGMEFLFSYFYPEIMGEAGESARKKGLGTTLDGLMQNAMVAEVEITAYSGNYKNVDELVTALDNIQYKYFPYSSPSWFIIPHIFESPGYYISYTTSAVNALEIYDKTNEDFEKAIDLYLELVKNASEDYEKALEDSGLTVKWTKEELDTFLNRIIEDYVDTDAPVIEGVEEGKRYSEGSQLITVKDLSGLGLLLSYGDLDDYQESRTFVAAGSNSPITLTVQDAFGNVTVINFTVDPYPFVVTAVAGKKSNKITWDAVPGAHSYKVYGASLGHKYKELGVTDSANMEFSHKVKANKTYKYYVAAYGVDESGNEVLLDKSLKCYVTGSKNSKKTGTEALDIDGDETFSVKTGKIIDLSVKRTLSEANEDDVAVGTIKPVRFISTDSNVASVSKTGKVTAVGTGSCYIYAVSENGICDRVEIKVS